MAAIFTWVSIWCWSLWEGVLDSFLFTPIRPLSLPLHSSTSCNSLQLGPVSKMLKPWPVKANSFLGICWMSPLCNRYRCQGTQGPGDLLKATGQRHTKTPCSLPSVSGMGSCFSPALGLCRLYFPESVHVESGSGCPCVVRGMLCLLPRAGS